MVVLLAFAAGYIVGAAAGSQDFDDVVDAVKAIGRSDEFHDLLAQPARPTPPTRCARWPPQLDKANSEGAGLPSVSTPGPRRPCQEPRRS